MNKIKTSLLVLFSTIALLFMTAVIFLVWTVYNPSYAYRYIEKNYLPKDLLIQPENVIYKVKHFGLRSLRVQLDVKNLLILKKNPDTKIKFETLNFDVELEFFKPKLKVYDFKMISKTQSSIHVSKSSGTSELQPVSLGNRLENLKKYFSIFTKYVVVLDLKALIENLEFKNSDQIPTQIAFDLSGSQELNYKLSAKIISDKHNLNFIGNLKWLKWKESKDFLSIDLNYNSPTFEIDLRTQVNAKENNLNSQTQGESFYKLSGRRIRIKPKIDFSINQKFITSNLILDLDNLPGPIPRISNISASLKIPLKENYEFKSESSFLNIQVPVKTNFVDKKIKAEIETRCKCEFPQQLISKLESDFLLPNIIDSRAGSLDIGKFKLSVETISNKVFSLNLDASSSISKSNNQYHLEPRVDADLLIKSFNKMIPIVDYFGIVIPAPLHVLDGQVHLKSGDVKISSTDYLLPFEINVDLNSKSQRVKLIDTSSVKVTKDFKKIFLENLVKIKSIVLDLPDLSPSGGIPRLRGDDRILTKDRLKDAKLKDEDKVNGSKLFEMVVDIECESKDAIQLKSKYFKPYMPLNVNFKTTKDLENSGVINIEPFNVVYLRRKARLERMKLEMNKKIPEKIFVDGQFTVQQSLYKVIVNVNGDSASPNIILSSEPELSRADIISVLLYDKTRNELVPSDVETAGGVEAAFTVKAIGLFSLWALASTPIRSFNYNPVTKVYTATLVLGDGVTAGIGSDWESAAQFELRKRLSKRWVLTGRWVSATTVRRERSELILQWESRF